MKKQKLTLIFDKMRVATIFLFIIVGNVVTLVKLK